MGIPIGFDASRSERTATTTRSGREPALPGLARARAAKLRRRLSGLAVLLLVACGTEHPDEPSLSAAVRATVDALSTRDMAKLWATVDTPTRQALLDVVRELTSARAKVAEVWPESDRARALAALGADLVEQAGSDDEGRGPRLLGALIDPSQINFSQEILDGLSARDVTVEAGPPPRANVFTSVGETFVFVREGDEWRSLFVREHLLETGVIPVLKENAQKTLAFAVEREKAWRTSLDPRTPQGSYNLARAAQTKTPPDIDALFSLLDDDGRKALGDVLEAARAAQRAIQRSVAKPNRRDAYQDAGLTRLVDATSDRDLYKRWAASTDFVLPLAVTDEPLRVEGPAEGPDAVVVTAAGRVAMRRDGDTFWRIAGQRAEIERALKRSAPRAKNGPSD